MAKGDNQVGGGVFPGIYNSALEQTGEDYDSLMGQYKQLSSMGRPSSSLAYSPISPTFANYTPGSNFTDLRNIASTGGLSGGEIADIRARDIAPIRSIYASGQRELERQKNLAGGYSPNFGAASAKMARDMSSIIGDRTSASNANIAELTSRNKLAAATSLSPLEARNNELMNRLNEVNASASNRANEFNAATALQYQRDANANQQNDFENILRGIQGQQSVYGQTPGLMNTLGNQTLNAANITSDMSSIPRGYLSGPRRNYSGPGSLR